MSAHSDHVEAVLQAKLHTSQVARDIIGLQGRTDDLLTSVTGAVGDGSIASLHGMNLDGFEAREDARRLRRDVEGMLAVIAHLGDALERYQHTLD